MLYLLDTNICIYLIKRRPENVLERFNELSLGDIGISSITVYEMVYGAERSRQVAKSLQALQQFLAPLEMLSFDEEDAYEAGKIRAYLAEKGQIIGPYDLQIAGQARRRNLTLITNNLSEFCRVPDLSVENWVE